MPKGLVVKNTGSHYRVRTDSGALFDCKVKGNFRLKGLRSTSPVAVGDNVTFEVTVAPSSLPGAVGEGWITDIDDRTNYIIRKASNLSKQSHIIAANVDQCLLMVTVSHPETSTVFIDRFLAVSEAYRIPVHIVINKADLYDSSELRIAELLSTLYNSLGYSCHIISCANNTLYPGPSSLLPFLEGRTTLLSGNSGVGKSTLLNLLLPDACQKTAALSAAHDTGMHTTTFSEMFALPGSGWLIDTPGIKGFGTFDMEREEVSHYFRELFALSPNCRYGNCTHTHEPGCAVRDALDKGLVAPSRYASYLSMLEDKEETKYR
ncbi:MAG: ribosome small subunit-dependent GTPase A [Bacteroidaceae bacterium]|nr:ribosome small subunit-dependent GTPase A [Bacteroidaceae bacterium]